MLQKIVMSTDGSAESEKPCAIAAQLARAHDAELTLVRIEEFSVPSADGAPAMSPELYAQFLANVQVEARRSLDELAERVRAEGVRVRTVLQPGNAAAELLDYVAAEHPDLVVMATHGRTGLARFTMGSVTDRMVRAGTAPVLVTRIGTEPSGHLERALVLLDGSPLAEEVLPLVSTLAGKPLQHLILYRTVAELADRGPAETYLEGIAARLRPLGVATEVKVDLGDPRPNVERVARDADVVILCTHGRSGFDRLRHGSVAEHVMHTVETPVLLVRAAAGHE